LNLDLSKTAEKPLNRDYKHYMFQVSKQKETQKPQIQHQPAKETPQKQKLGAFKFTRKQKKWGFAGEISITLIF